MQKVDEKLFESKLYSKSIETSDGREKYSARE